MGPLLSELEDAGLLKDSGYQREIFEVTHEGYQKSDRLGPDGAPEQPVIRRLEEEERTLLSEAAADPHGMVMRLKDSAGLTITTNNKPLFHGRDARLSARWEKAIETRTCPVAESK